MSKTSKQIIPPKKIHGRNKQTNPNKQTSKQATQTMRHRNERFCPSCSGQQGALPGRPDRQFRGARVITEREAHLTSDPIPSHVMEAFVMATTPASWWRGDNGSNDAHVAACWTLVGISVGQLIGLRYSLGWTLSSGCENACHYFFVMIGIVNIIGFHCCESLSLLSLLLSLLLLYLLSILLSSFIL